MMKIVSVFFGLIILFSCQEKAPTIVEEKATAVVQEASKNPVLEEKPLKIELDSIKSELSISDTIAFFNNYLVENFNDRIFQLEDNNAAFSYDISLAENIEGGGVSTHYLNVIENGVNVGIIGFGSFDTTIYTTCVAILSPDNFISWLRVVDVDNTAILEVYSNTSGLLAEGPFDVNYFGFDRAKLIAASIFTRVVKEETPLSRKDKANLLNAWNAIYNI